LNLDKKRSSFFSRSKDTKKDTKQVTSEPSATPEYFSEYLKGSIDSNAVNVFLALKAQIETNGKKVCCGLQALLHVDAGVAHLLSPCSSSRSYWQARQSRPLPKFCIPHLHPSMSSLLDQPHHHHHYHHSHFNRGCVLWLTTNTACCRGTNRIPGVSEVMVACIECCRSIMRETPKFVDDLCKEDILIRFVNLLSTNAQCMYQSVQVVVDLVHCSHSDDDDDDDDDPARGGGGGYSD
jgi:hypothetical protein